MLIDALWNRWVSSAGPTGILPGVGVASGFVCQGTNWPAGVPAQSTAVVAWYTHTRPMYISLPGSCPASYTPNVGSLEVQCLAPTHQPQRGYRRPASKRSPHSSKTTNPDTILSTWACWCLCPTPPAYKLVNCHLLLTAHHGSSVASRSDLGTTSNFLLLIGPG